MSQKTGDRLPTILEDILEFENELDVGICVLFNCSLNVLTTTKAISIADFDVLRVLDNDHAGAQVALCRKRDSCQTYTLKTMRSRGQSIWPERAILEMTNELNIPFCPRMYWSFQDDEYLYIAMVCRQPRSIALHFC
jgi:hypothetical protein